MAIDRVREHLARWGRHKDILEFEVSSATVELAAHALGVAPARIAKTLSFRKDDSALLVVAAGDARTDNAKFKSAFGLKARMLDADEVLAHTGHAVGGVCPFGLAKDLPVYLDVSLKRFETVYPACGSSNSAVRLTCSDLEKLVPGSCWVDVCRDWETTGESVRIDK